MIKEIRTVTITEKGQITIPKELRKISGFAVGNKISIIAREDSMELVPLDYIERMECALLSEKSLAKEWLTPEEDAAWKDLDKETLS